MVPQIPENEVSRLAALRRYEILDTGPEKQFDDLTLLASYICQTPVAMISLIDSGRQWYKSKHGSDVSETTRDVSFCGHAILMPADVMVVPDARDDKRFFDNPQVTSGPEVRFYAGAPLVTPSGEALGALCVIDQKPKELRADQIEALRALARQVVSQLELRRSAAENARLYLRARRLAARAAHVATHDALTRLPNRILFAERVGQCLTRARHDPDYRFAVMFMDLDRFKNVNDSLGHAAGDALLTTVGRRIRTALRGDGDRPARGQAVARFGGDEFTILLEDVRDEQQAATIAHRILNVISRPFLHEGQLIDPAASIGIALCDGDYLHTDDILRDADAALYRAKQAGKGRCVVFDKSMHEEALKRLRLETDLRRAVDRGELVLYYQPVMALLTGGLRGFEALVRWNHEGQLVSPADFIPIAEDTGAIVGIGRWVLSEALRQVAEWKTNHPDLPQTRVAINLSRRQLQDPSLVLYVADLLATYRLDPSYVMLEITESVIMNDSVAAREVLNRLRGLGVKLGMDDFGTGYSSLSCLHNLPVDVLKVDRSFVANATRRRDASVLYAVMELAHNLGMDVVAEGVETAEQVAFLQGANCDFAQGYYFNRPLLAAEAAKLLGVTSRATLAA